MFYSFFQKPGHSHGQIPLSLGMVFCECKSRFQCSASSSTLTVNLERFIASQATFCFEAWSSATFLPTQHDLAPETKWLKCVPRHGWLVSPSTFSSVTTPFPHCYIPHGTTRLADGSHSRRSYLLGSLHCVWCRLTRIIQILFLVCPILRSSQLHISPGRCLGSVVIIHNLSILHMLAQRGVDTTLF